MGSFRSGPPAGGDDDTRQGNPLGPDWARHALASADIRATFRATAICGNDTEAWATVVAGDRAIEAWRSLRAERPSGWWPIIVGGTNDEERLVEGHAYASASPEEVLRLAGQIDPTSVLDRRFAEAADYGGDEDDVIGPWPSQPPPQTSYSLTVDILSREPRPTVLAIVPVDGPAEVPAVLAWGNWNDCPPAEEHVAIHRRWALMYGTELVGISADVIEMQVARPPTSRADAMVLAREHFAYCPDIVMQGTATISNLAATLLNSPTWYFWWD